MSVVKRSATLLAQAVIVVVGAAAVAVLLWEPHLEGRNAHATTFEIYFRDPFLAFAYVASIAFFVALYQAFKVLGWVRQNKAFSPEALRALRTIRYCAMALIGFVAAGETFILLSESDDRAGGVFMGILIASGAVFMAAAATVIERGLQKKMLSAPARG